MTALAEPPQMKEGSKHLYADAMPIAQKFVAAASARWTRRIFTTSLGEFAPPAITQGHPVIMAKEKCFIIAPISTATDRAPLYLNDSDHCEHVVEHLLAPAVEKAGFDPIKPKAKGANLIQAEIVANLQTVALVLCDMSGLNPNVFFELGIRTAMNKPICLTIDQATKNAPFDLGVINHHSYVSDLRPWILPGEIAKLAAHIQESATEKENALWKYFSLRLTADTAQQPPGPDGKMDLLLSEVDALRRQLTGTQLSLRRQELTRNIPPDLARALERKDSLQDVIDFAGRLGLNLWQYSDQNGRFNFVIDPKGATEQVLAQLATRASALGVSISVEISPMGIQPD